MEGEGIMNEPDDRWQDWYDRGHEAGYDQGVADASNTYSDKEEDLRYRIKELEKGIEMAIEILEAKR